MFDLNAVKDFLNQEIVWGNSVHRWITAVAAALAIWLALRFVKATLAHRAMDRAEHGAGDWFRAAARALKQTRQWLLFILAVYCGGILLELPGHVSRLLDSVAIVAVLIQAAFWADALLAFAIRRYAERNREVDAASVTTLSAIGFLGRLAIWTSMILLALSNLGVNITAMITGLGIGGVAVALAAQNILGDLFASFSIVLDKPFVLGDFIIIDDKMGTIEYIGLKSTRLRSLTGEQLVISNADLLKSRIHNYKRMNERRIVFTIGVVYETPYETLASIPTILREIIESQQNVRFDRAHFARYGDSALVFEVVYYVLSSDYIAYMDVQQAVNLAIFRQFSEKKISFAYPTRTVHLARNA